MGGWTDGWMDDKIECLHCIPCNIPPPVYLTPNIRYRARLSEDNFAFMQAYPEVGCPSRHAELGMKKLSEFLAKNLTCNRDFLCTMGLFSYSISSAMVVSQAYTK